MNSESEKVQQFVTLLTAHQSRIYSFILSLVPIFNEADDIMQETSKMMWVLFDQFDRGTDFVAWGIKIARFRILEHRRRMKSNLKFGDMLLQEIEEKSQKRQDNSKEYLNYLKNCIQKLNPKDQTLMLLRYQQDLKVKDISSRLNKSVQSIYQNIARIQDLLLICVRKAIFLDEV
ncbi:MAG: sigma-70 family RNA polymerase sigma factor [Planctomycetaceae bacterium]|nr:sigma-70 family RNA polymerase sigma factor [Planctomycetaceae bacterium]